ncbi:MAG: nucleoside-diphosphate kinase [Proteobacteria bacterium]|jgi:nucleoside-diphosphate kinase|nr:nucleoside-diphosphate kinase [Pseudomonadota bacterium]
MEKTLSIIKPDAVKRQLMGEIIRRLEENNLKVVAAKMLFLSKKEAEGFYAVHRGKAFFESLTKYMSSGPILVMVLEGESAIARNRIIMGATNPAEAAPGTIRKEFGTSIERNSVHGSDSPETAAFEISYFFKQDEIHTY